MDTCKTEMNRLLDRFDKFDSATHPSHYPNSRHGDIISLCMSGDIGFCEGNIIKYVSRWRKKNGIEDLLKAKTYLNRLIRFYKDETKEL